MSTLNSKAGVAVVARTTKEKIAILRGIQTVSYTEMTVDDWAELIDQLIKDYKPYLKYVHPFTTVEAHVEGIRPGARVVVQSVRKSTRITPLYQWQRPENHIELQLFLDQEGGLVLDSLTGIPDSTDVSSKTVYHYELCNVLSTVQFLTQQSALGAFPGVALGEEIVRGLFGVFDRSIKHKAKMLQNLETIRDHLQGLLSRVKY
jgi:hypothetical protein